MIELHQGKDKIYINPKFIEALIEIKEGTKVVLNSGITLAVDDCITDIEFELREIAHGQVNLGALLGGE